jgi:glycosyltransferase involved in cell wall biosynthesis
MTVVHTYPTFVPTLVEGISKNIDGLCRALRRNGVDATLDAPAVALADLNQRRHLVRLGREAGRRAAHAAADPATSLVHFHVSLPSMARFASAARRVPGGAPVLLHAWNAFRQGPAPAAVPRRDRIAHRVANGALAARWGFGGPGQAVVSSQFQRRQLEAIGWPGDVHVVPSGVDLDRNRPATADERAKARRELGLGDGPVLLYYGHTSSWKGLGTLLEALPAVLAQEPRSQAVLALTAYGGRDDWVHERIRRAGLQGRIVVRGTSHVPSLHAAADVAAVPCLAEVGTACHPNVLLECMAAGLPVVASRVASIPEVVTHRRNGLLVTPGDATDLAGRLLELVADERLRRRLGEAARSAMETGHGWDAVAKRMHAVYRLVAPSTPRARTLGVRA